MNKGIEIINMLKNTAQKLGLSSDYVEGAIEALFQADVITSEEYNELIGELNNG